MAASYPSSLPVKDAAGANLSTNPHSTLHDAMYDEIVAIATELGTLPKGTAASVKARLDALPRGVVGYAQATSNQGSITTLTDRTSLTYTFTAVSGRRYEIIVFTILASSVAADIASVTIDIGGSQVQAGTLEVGLLGSNGDRSITVPYSSSTLSGSVTAKARVQRSAGSGNITSIATTSAPSFILIKDVGVL